MDQHIAAWTLKRLRAAKSGETIELLPFKENGKTVYQSPPHLRRPLEREMKKRRNPLSLTTGPPGSVPAEEAPGCPATLPLWPGRQEESRDTTAVGKP